MDLPELKVTSNWEEVPSEFHSYMEEGLFKHCVMCNTFLLHEGTNYLIEKAIKRNKTFNIETVVFEYAICMNCAENMKSQLSSDSIEKISAYIGKASNLGERRDSLLNNNSGFDKWIDTCIVTGESREDCEEYQIVAQCNGPHLLYTFLPYMIGGKAMEEMQGLLSPQSKDEMDDFTDHFNGLPPEYKELLKDRDLVLL